jgi:DedD protein
MNGPYGNDNLNKMDESVEREREISLGTSTVLGIFFALALVCALFFGFGYTVGRRSAPTVANAPEATPIGSSTSKPPSGSPESHSSSGNTSSDDSADTGKTSGHATDAVTAPVPDNPVPRPASDTKSVTIDTRSNSQPAEAAAKVPAKVTPPPIAASPTTAAASGSLVVQIAAVSHREDADILVSTLTRRGYDVAIRQEPQDKLMHVQIGPFANKKDADAMRTRLLADGYNAIVK